MSGNREIPADVMERAVELRQQVVWESNGSIATIARALMAERPRWIPVEEGLPPVNEKVRFMFSRFSQPFIGRYVDQGCDMWTGHMEGTDIYAVGYTGGFNGPTFYQYLPPVPETETE